MRDLSFQEALDDPELPFQQFVQGRLDLWTRAVEIYGAAGGLHGPAEDGDNLASLVLAKLNALAAIGEVEELLGFDECEE